MKHLRLPLLIAVLCMGLVSAQAQRGGGGGGGMGSASSAPDFSGSMSKLFGDNTTFTSTLDIQTTGGPRGGSMSLPAKMAYDHGKTRVDIDMSKNTGSGLPPNAAAQMKAMGMEQMISISRPDKKAHYLIYPGMSAYAELIDDPAKPISTPENTKLEMTELGKETFDGHPCVKNKATITDEKGQKHDLMVWDATDLKNFPVKIEQSEGGMQVTVLFKDVKFSKVEAAHFEPPSGLTKYDSIQTMMMQEMAKRRGGR